MSDETEKDGSYCTVHSDGADEPSSEASAEARQGSPARARKRKGGAPRGNSNAAVHLLRSKKLAKDRRDKHERRAEKEALAILKSAGKESDPMAKLLARQVKRLEAAASRIEEYLRNRGHFDKDGNLKPAVSKLIDVTDRLLGEARRLIGAISPPVESMTLMRLITASMDEPTRDDGEHAKGHTRGRSSASPRGAEEAERVQAIKTDADLEGDEHDRGELDRIESSEWPPKTEGEGGHPVSVTNESASAPPDASPRREQFSDSDPKGVTPNDTNETSPWSAKAREIVEAPELDGGDDDGDQGKPKPRPPRLHPRHARWINGDDV